MPPTIALILCSVFVLFLLRIEQKQSPDVSFVLWIPTVYMLLIAGKPLGIWFQMREDIETGSVLDRYFIILLLSIGLIILAKRHIYLSSVINDNIWMILILGYMFISILWSDITFISFKRWIREVPTIIMALIVLTERNPRQAMESILRRNIYILIPFSVLLIKYFTKYGCLYDRWSGKLMWVGVCMQKNSLCLLCAIAAFFQIWTLVRRLHGGDTPVVRYQIILDIIILFIAFLLFGGPQLSFSYSATSTIAFIVVLMAFIALLLLKKLNLFIGTNTLSLIFTFIIIYGVLTPMIGRLTLFDFSSAVGRNETLTGRTDVWNDLFPAAMSHPILGHGYGGFWTTRTHAMYEISGAHNGYLDIMLELGLLGLLLHFMFWMSIGRKAQWLLRYDYDWGAFGICIILLALSQNITESSLNAFSTYISAIIVFYGITSISIIRHNSSKEDTYAHFTI